ncbi:MAG: ABC transporter substrate-binding protein [Rhodospirillaceae bacterium]|nr:ABC transporter substrate-binding protein [Rhodospirillaceae bacterium]
MAKNNAKNNFIAKITTLFSAAILTGGLFLSVPTPVGANEQTPIRIGLDADMSSASAESGEAIRRGMVVAVDEINEKGGINGRKLEIVVRDHRGNPARGIDNINEFSADKSIVAVMGGLHTPVAMAELEAIHKNDMLYLVPWAAGTMVVDNGFSPNNVFRVSVRDQYAGRFLTKMAASKGYKKLGLLLEQTGWGRSNEKAISEAAREIGVEISGVEWISWGAKNAEAQIGNLAKKGADVIMLVANANEGAVVLAGVANMDKTNRLAIISHWGITGGRFTELVGSDIDKVNLSFLQTYSFVVPTRPEKEKDFFARYQKLFPEITKAEQILSPVGTAHAYDLVHLLNQAIINAGSLETAKIRVALENIKQYDGLVKTYNPPFTSNRHDALDESSFTLAKFLNDGSIVPTAD